MRLNKKKLAALAMSAVMAASTMPFSVLAEEFTDMSEATVATERNVGDVVKTTFTFDEVDHTVVFHYPDGTDSQPVAAFLYTTQKLTCEKPEKKQWRAEDPRSGQVYEITASFETVAAVGNHTWGTNTYWKPTKEATCLEAGEEKLYHKCTVCGEEAVVDAPGVENTREISQLEHTFGATLTKVCDTAPYKPFNVDGNFQLKDTTKDGYYYIQYYHVCSTCKTPENIGEPERVDVLCDKSAVVDYYKVVLKDGHNIKSAITGEYTKISSITADSEIKLQDCTKDGEYWIEAYHRRSGADDALVYTEKHVVPAHHCTLLAIKDQAKYPTLTIVTENGVKRVKNLSCSEAVTYVEETYCTAETGAAGAPGRLINTEKKTAQPEGTHRNAYMNTSKATIKANTTDGYISKNTYTTVVNNASAYNYKVTVTGDCADEVTITVTYLCDECKEETVDSITVKCKDLTTHVWKKNSSNQVITEKTNIVEPTCFKEGSYDTVKTCDVCGKQEIVRTGVVIPATGKHSFKDEKTGAIDYTDAHIKFTGTKVVDKEGANVSRKGQTYDATNALYSVSAASVIKCETCGEEIAQTPAVTLTVVDVKKETEKEAGSITLKATWYTTDKKVKLEDTCTVPYFSNVAAYLDRNPDKDPINGLHKDEDGVWRYYENNEVTDFTGIAEYQGGKFFVANGVLCSDAKGLNLYNGEWYFLAGGQIQTQVTGLAMYNGEWFFLTNGKLDRSKTGLVEYDGAKFIIAKGELQRYSGLWQDPADGTWYFAALGQIQEQYTGTAIYDGQTFELVNGKLVR